VGKIIDQAIGSKHHSFQIVDSENNHIGCFALNQLKNLLEEKDIVDSFVIAQDLAVADIKLDYEDNLEKAMTIFGQTDVAEIAVVQKGKFAGVVKRKDVIEAYNHEILKREAAAGLVQKLKFTTQTKSFDFGSGYKIMEMDAPYTFWNKSLKELNLKALHRIDVLLIKRKYPPQTITIPPGNEIIRRGDRLIIAGPEENISKIISGKKE
jgi:CIC family chloride channel protein